MRLHKALAPTALILALGLSGCSSIPFLNSGDSESEVISESGMTAEIQANMSSAFSEFIQVASIEGFSEAIQIDSEDESIPDLSKYGEAVERLNAVVAGDSHLQVLANGVLKELKDKSGEANGMEMEALSRGKIIAGLNLASAEKMTNVLIDPDGFELKDGVWYQVSNGAIAVTDDAGVYRAVVPTGAIGFTEDGSQLSPATAADAHQFADYFLEGLLGKEDVDSEVKELQEGLTSIAKTLEARYHPGVGAEVLAHLDDFETIVAEADKIIAETELPEGVSASFATTTNGERLNITISNAKESWTYDSSIPFSYMGENVTGFFLPTSLIPHKANALGDAYVEMDEEHGNLSGDFGDEDVSTEALVKALNENEKNADVTWSLGAKDGVAITAAIGDESAEFPQELVDSLTIPAMERFFG